MNVFLTGSYSDSVGVEVIRRDIASYIAKRDGVESNFNDVFLSTGASDGIKVIKMYLRFMRVFAVHNYTRKTTMV